MLEFRVRDYSLGFVGGLILQANIFRWGFGLGGLGSRSTFASKWEASIFSPSHDVSFVLLHAISALQHWPCFCIIGCLHVSIRNQCDTDSSPHVRSLNKK